MAQAHAKQSLAVSRLADLAARARRRLRGPDPLVANNRRLVAVTVATYTKLEAVAKAVSREVGFVVFPMQIAAILIEREMER